MKLKKKSGKGNKNTNMKMVHKGPKVHKCDPCGKLFTQASKLKIHIKTIHEGHKDFKCDSCGKVFTVYTSW